MDRRYRPGGLAVDWGLAVIPNGNSTGWLGPVVLEYRIEGFAKRGWSLAEFDSAAIRTGAANELPHDQTSSG